MNAYVPPGQTAAPASLTPTRRELLEERASDRAACLLETLAPHDRIRDEMDEVWDELDRIGALIGGRCTEFGYDCGQDRIDAGRRATLALMSARALMRTALDELKDTL